MANNTEILRKAIDKARKNGYCDVSTDIFSHSFAKAFWGKELVCRICGTPKSEKQSIASCDGCLTPILSEQDEKYYYISKWQHCLQQMVLEENPLQYLAKFLDV